MQENARNFYNLFSFFYEEIRSVQFFLRKLHTLHFHGFRICNFFNFRLQLFFFFKKVWLFQIKAVPLQQQIPPRFSSQGQRTRVGRFFKYGIY